MKTSDAERRPRPSPKPPDVTTAAYQKEARYRPVIETAYVGWWEGESFRAVLGVLRDVSAGGAAVVLEDAPPGVETVWLCVAGPGRVTWTPARVAGRENGVLRLCFTERFPDELFDLLVWGFDAGMRPVELR
jgi:hypothetical protein